MSIVFRELQERDFESLFITASKAWLFTYREIYDRDVIAGIVKENYRPERLRQLLPDIKKGRFCFEVALEEGRVVGYCAGGLNQGEIALHRLYLDPEYIGCGLGTRLLEKFEAYVRKHGCRRYYCYVDKKNETGLRFYLKGGFEHQPIRDNADDFFLEKRLDMGIISSYSRKALHQILVFLGWG